MPDAETRVELRLEDAERRRDAHHGRRDRLRGGRVARPRPRGRRRLGLGGSADGARRPVRARRRCLDVADADAVFAALADPTRRGILLVLAGGDRRHGERARAQPADQPSGRLQAPRALAEAGLVESERNGRETRYRPTPEPLDEAAAWMAEVGALWDARLAALARFVDTGS